MEKAKEKLNLEKTLRSIEYAAFNSYQQDMAGITKKAKFPRPGVEQMTQQEQFMAAEQQTLEKEEEKKKIAKLALEKVQEIQSKSVLETAQTSAAVTESEWTQYYSPEGYPYYYSNKTGGRVMK